MAKADPPRVRAHAGLDVQEYLPGRYRLYDGDRIVATADRISAGLAVQLVGLGDDKIGVCPEEGPDEDIYGMTERIGFAISERKLRQGMDLNGLESDELVQRTVNLPKRLSEWLHYFDYPDEVIVSALVAHIEAQRGVQP